MFKKTILFSLLFLIIFGCSTIKAMDADMKAWQQQMSAGNVNMKNLAPGQKGNLPLPPHPFYFEMTLLANRLCPEVFPCYKVEIFNHDKIIRICSHP